MATITLTIPDAIVPRVLEAFALEYSYNPETDGTKAQFTKVKIVEFLKRTVREAEGALAIKAAKLSSDNDVATSIIIT